MRDEILSILRKSNKKMDPIDILKFMKSEYATEDVKQVLDVLYELVSEGLVIPCKRNTFKITKDEYLRGKIEVVNSGNAWFLMKPEDIYIDKRNLNNALDGDEVLVETYKRFGKLEAKVKRIVSRNLPLGEICIDNDVTYVKPLKEYKYNLILVPNNDIQLVEGEIVTLESVREELNGIVVKVKSKVGHKNSPDIDTLKVMAEMGVPTGFSKETEKAVKLLPSEVLESDYKGRTDISNEVIFTIDGKDTKDIDDAIGLKILDNGNYLLNVSIADVSNYVKWNGPIFVDAYTKGNSTYMADKVEPMLPIELSNGICSLNEGVLRCAVTTEVEITKNGDIVNKRMYPSIIKSKKKMNYDDVQTIIEGGHVEGYNEFESVILSMRELSKVLQQRKYERGNLEFKSDEIKLIIDNNGKVTSVEKRVQREAEKLIEDFMIVSNEASIELLTEVNNKAIFRIHGTPNGKKIEEFIKFISNLGITLTGKYNYNNIKNSDIQSILKQIKGKPNEDLINDRLLRSMQKAIYSTDNIGHFGLGSKMYTHETSPIRRMSDLLLHYLIKINLFKMDMGVSSDEISRGLPEACEHISMTERRSDDTEYAVNDMKLAEYMEGHIGEEYNARVVTLLKNGFFVETDKFIEGFVSLETINNYYTLSDDGLYYYDRKKRQALTIGDKIKVKCVSASKETRHIDFVLVEEKDGNTK